MESQSEHDLILKEVLNHESTQWALAKIKNYGKGIFEEQVNKEESNSMNEKESNPNEVQQRKTKRIRNKPKFFTYSTF